MAITDKKAQVVNVGYVRNILSMSIGRELDALHKLLGDDVGLRDFDRIDDHLSKLKASVRSLDVLDGNESAKSVIYDLDAVVSDEQINAVEQALADFQVADDQQTAELAKRLAPTNTIARPGRD